MKNITQITVFQNEEFAKYSFVTILLRILQFSQNTKNSDTFAQNTAQNFTQNTYL